MTPILKKPSLDDLLLAADDGEVGCLVLSDLSAAFDTVDHCIILQKLSSSAFGLHRTWKIGTRKW